MIFGANKKLLERLDEMLDEAIAGTFQVETFDESLLSKIESKMLRFLEKSQLKQEQIEGERERVRLLISDISHQTKTPLANIALYAGLLAEQDLSDEQAKLAGQITASSEKLNFLIQSLVKTSRLESGVIKIEPKPGNVYELISSAIRECESLAIAKNIALSTVQGDKPISALYDPRWCGEALFNIIENAVKYTPACTREVAGGAESGCVAVAAPVSKERGQVTITTARPERGQVTVSATEYEMFVRIDVTDTGRGIREGDLPKVFGRFWRAEESADSPGVGIGLYLAREIITACGGYVKVSSELGVGSTFSVFLPKV